MGRSSAVRIPCLTVLLLLGTVAIYASHASRVGVQIDPARTWVGIARVYLEVSDLWLAGSSLEGRYEIRVPMLPSKNDSGTISLELDAPLDSLRVEGGHLDGSARSTFDGSLRTVTCEVENDGDIVIVVTMPDRTLEFHSRYRTLDQVPGQRL